MAFTATELHAIHLHSFLSDYACRVLIEGDNMVNFLQMKLQGSSLLTRHTTIVHIQTASAVSSCNTTEYLFSHDVTQPWGQQLPFNCPGCKCIRRWNPKKSTAKDVDAVHKCGTANCSTKHTTKKLKGVELFCKDVGQGVWFAKLLKLPKLST